ncbi:glyoxylate/hydroxypyruvate reductase A [Thioclava sp. SK-1]|uniref:2-hydroxyacid dehydrogenase n=1 Tax=Thioclava sp. SK-1 TaxID=1889770 RepID=UPI000824B92D|nr:glyoxylate/hydroxypyruvate reductase A [Thioclava sp. SK-1]OCX59979.1 glyoxylate/hydroxypyruvate reductase A [Thioclava sp. SK-1]
MALLFMSLAERGAVWARVFEQANERFILGEDAVTDPAEVTHLACWQPPADLTVYPNLQAVISVGAGVDQMPAMPPGVTLSRTIAPGIEEMVRDWVVMASLMLHRDMPQYLEQAGRGEWSAKGVTLARKRRVGIMGMGRIGRLAAASLSAMGFNVVGYSRSGTPVDGLNVFGADQLGDFLAQSDLLVCLLPLTPQTEGMMDAAFFAQLPQGALLVHAGRGKQLDMAALRTALDAGQIGAAMLDVTEPEPLPNDHWAWSDPRVVITPHVGSSTDHEEGARHALAVLAASRSGLPIPGEVDQQRGY